MIDSTRPITVSELTTQIKDILEHSFPDLWVAGEISNFKHHGSGHMYFTLKDERAELRAVMFRGNNRFIHFKPNDGMQVLTKGRITVYEQRGQYQLIVQQMEPAGIGTLYLAFEALKKQLADEGLFDPRCKKPLPVMPLKIGIITSPSGAALQDIIQILKRRAAHVNLVIRPTLVQGEGAADDIVKAIGEFESWGQTEVLIVGRGGGSLEDLWPFNEERVARAIHACTIPVISAVGHETDFTIADLVADQRAPTPSAAVEIVTPARQELLERIDQYTQIINKNIQRRLEQNWQYLDSLTSRYAFVQPQKQLERFREQLSDRHRQILRTYGNTLKMFSSRLTGLHEKLNVLNPQNVLERGYSIAYSVPQREVIRTAEAIAVGALFELKTAKGSLLAEKKSTKK